MRRRPNFNANRYNQYVIAGKIAVETGAIDPYGENGKIHSVYKIDNNTLHYSVIGQDYLDQLELKVTEL